MNDTDEYEPDGGDSEYDYGTGDDPLEPYRGTVHTPAPGAPGGPLRDGDTLLGRYRLLRRFAGGMSQVWAAWDLDIGRFVVLKFVGRLLDEARRAVNVPGRVIHVLGYNAEVESNPFLVLEYARGGPLDRYNRIWATDPARLVRLFIPAVETLTGAHGRNIRHRDLKPSNLLLWAPPPAAPVDGTVPELPPPPTDSELTAMEVRVADWGLATSEGDAGSGYGGTPGFAAPEQWGEAATPLSDVFGLAATLYFLLANPNYDPDDVQTHANLHFAADPSGAARAAGRNTTFRPRPLHELNPNVDTRLSRVVMRSLAVDPDERHDSASALADELTRWLNHLPLEDQRDDRRTRARLWLRRNPVAAAVTVIMLALTSLAVASTLIAAQARVKAAEQERDVEAARAEARVKEEEQRRLRTDVELRLSEAKNANQTNQLAAAARAAARRGDWKTALDQYAKLIAGADPATALILRAERLFGYFATNEEGLLISELKALAAEPDLAPASAARVQLVRGAHVMCDVFRADEARKLIRQALAARAALPADRRDELFPPADALYGEALLETKPLPLVRKLTEAVKLDTLHYPSHSALVMALIASGDAAAALRQSDLLAGLFPDSPVPACVRALTAMIDGDRKTMRRGLKELTDKARTPADADQMKLLTEYCELLADILDIMDKHTATIGGLNPLQMLVLGANLVKMRAIGASLTRPLAVPVPTVSLFFTWYLEVFDVYFQSGQSIARLGPAALPKIDADGERLTAMAADYPEALTHAMLATNRFAGATVAVNSNDAPDSARRLIAAAAAGYTAAEQPTLATRAPVRFTARFTGVISDVILLKFVPDLPPLHLQRVHDNLPRLITESRGKWHEHRDQIVALTVGMIVVETNPGLKAQWKLDTPAGYAAYRERNRQLYRVARTLLDTWADEPALPRKAKQKAIQEAELRTALERWAVAEVLTPPLAPSPRPK